jgi:hypothetical protein
MRTSSFVAALVTALALRSAGADTLTLRDGRVVEGTVEKDGEVYRVASRFGEAEIPAKDVVSWAKATSVEAQWRQRAATLAENDHAGRAELARWLVEQGRELEGRALASRVVELDPENAVAHAVLGHVRHGGAWMTPDEAKRADGLVRRGDRWYTPAEWDLLDAAAKEKAGEAERIAAGKRLNAAVNEATRLMLAPDPALRAEGKRRLEALARESKSADLSGLVEKVSAYADAVDRYAAAAAARATATALTECRITLARLKRPIQQFQTSLASNINSAPVVIQLPEIEIIKVNTTVPIPATTSTGP